MADTREGQVRVGADVPSAREKAGYSLWVEQQPKVVGCCPGGQALTVRNCCNPSWRAAPSIQTGVWERRDGRWCEPWEWRFVDVKDIVSCGVYAQPHSLWQRRRLIDQRPFQLLVNKKLQGRASSSGLTQLVKSWESPAVCAVVQWVSWRTMTSALFL